MGRGSTEQPPASRSSSERRGARGSLDLIDSGCLVETRVGQGLFDFGHTRTAWSRSAHGKGEGPNMIYELFELVSCGNLPASHEKSPDSARSLVAAVWSRSPGGGIGWAPGAFHQQQAPATSCISCFAHCPDASSATWSKSRTNSRLCPPTKVSVLTSQRSSPSGFPASVAGGL